MGFQSNSFMAGSHMIERLCRVAVFVVLTLSSVSCGQSNDPVAVGSRAITINVLEGSVAGDDVIRVMQGERIELFWVTDEPLEIHLHGYDIEKEIQPGRNVSMRIETHATGRFPITSHPNSYPNSHHADSFLEHRSQQRASGHSHSSPHSVSASQVERTLVYLEVYPQ